MSDAKVNFTLDDVVAKIREVAAERPTYVYEKPWETRATGGATVTCFYRHGAERETPGCIVGVALDRLGYVVPEQFEGKNASNMLSVLLDVAEPSPRLSWVRSVQARQDEGKSWGDAISETDHYSYIYAGIQ